MAANSTPAIVAHADQAVEHYRAALANQRCEASQARLDAAIDVAAATRALADDFSMANVRRLSKADAALTAALKRR